jgi:hypothetical protein
LSSIAISLAVALSLLVATGSGALLRRCLPTDHLNDHTKDVVRLGAGLLATIVGLVLGLLINSARSNFDIQRDEVRQLTALSIMFDASLEQYGPEALPIRRELRSALDAAVASQWSGSAGRSSYVPFQQGAAGAHMYRLLVALAPTTETQRLYKAQAMTIAMSMLQQRLVLYEQGSSGSGLPTFLVAILVGWLFVLFVSFSLFSPLNATAVGAIVVIALSAAGAFFLIFEMFHPFDGVMQIDKQPLLRALAPLAP